MGIKRAIRLRCLALICYICSRDSPNTHNYHISTSIIHNHA